MSDQENEMIEDFTEEQLDEFKASMGDPSEVPEPTGANAKAPGSSKTQGDKSSPMQGSSEKAKVAEVPKTKMAMINAMVQSMNSMKKTDLAAAFGKMNSAMHKEEVEEEDDIDLAEFTDDFGDDTIQLLFSIGCDTARAVLELSADEIVSRTNDEIDEALARKIIEVIAYEFED